MEYSVPNRNFKRGLQWPPVKKFEGQPGETGGHNIQQLLTSISLFKKNLSFFNFLLFFFPFSRIALHQLLTDHLDEVHSIQTSQPFLFHLISDAERKWTLFWVSSTFSSQQVKNLGNPAMCRYLQGWSERELGSWYGSMNRKRSGVGLINFDKIQWIKMNCCSTHNWLNYYSDTNAIQLLRWWMDWSKKAHAKYWVNKTCGKLRSGGSWVQLLEWQPLLATALCWSSTWKLD